MSRYVFPGLRTSISSSAPLTQSTATAQLPSGEAGVEATLAAMAAMATDAAAMDSRFAVIEKNMKKAARDRFSVDPVTPLEIHQLFDVYQMMSTMEFQADPPGAELVYSPTLIVDQIVAGKKPRGDCDDRATFGVAIALRLFPRTDVAFVTYRRAEGMPFVHVAIAIRPMHEWIFMDPQERIKLGQPTTPYGKIWPLQ